MTLTKYRLGDLIQEVDERNKLGIRRFFGLNKDKSFMPTAASTAGLDETKYKLVRENRFVFSGMQTGRDEVIRIAMFTETEPIIVSPAYTTFEVVAKNVLLPEYLFMKFQSAEMDRYGWFVSDSSIRSNLDWDVFCDTQLPLPPIGIQQKYVDIYNALRQNSRLFEEAKSDLELAIEGYVDRVKRSSPMRKVGELLSEIDRRNHDGKVRRIRGIDISKRFIPSKAHVTKDAQRKYKIIHQGEFAYSAMQTGRDETIRIALKTDNEPFLVSPAYAVLAVKEQHEVLPEWIMLWFSRPESDRFGWFASDASVRASLELERFFEIEIPIPDMSTQFAVCNIYKQTIQRDVTANRVREQALEICPVLIRGSLAETTREEMP
ncbi:restriction endonuclease subunit S [Corynebacterium diphtheriae]|uniref:restriction endonuclease subunit S n=1 Tax=Corynebacterium diphtheriae TaxID=1717 RepID=UPI0002468C2A|nr:restriction endonuclease subunit S [Corynebacterium diphtheriae]AEX79922.1 type I restriction enzyme, S subunit [Corynebacterium diphtheriae HC03]KJJ59263.1 restriction endonuclease subunit S [Corynebacterium diphtheriae]CAB0783355.1 restriction endonuclease subunit S [Corynebacterium diphtheriae]CAB0924003.1 restriction endonuclease subunit S [Corynebacterium diphtheriae]CAB0924036.1 restriction endonuclease subunit S [Corynebacterium diphtheriae]